MRTILKVATIAVLSAIALIVFAVAATLGYRADLQHHNAQAFAIHTPNGIDEAMYVKIGGIDQWVQIRGQNRNNPVILMLHGGPGASWLPLTALFVPWEKDFTVVQWDQRGAGKTLETTGDSVAETMSIDRMTQYGLEVSEFLRNHLHKTKIILLGHSWGSILGIHMVKQRPDLFYAYVGTGQVSNLAKSLQVGYADTLRKARAANDARAIKELEDIGPPPYDIPDKLSVLFNWLGAYQAESDRLAMSSLGSLMFGAPNYSLRDIYYRTKGLSGFGSAATWRFLNAMQSTDLSRLGPNFQVPIYFFQGAEDEITVPSLAKEYFERIDAPYKRVVISRCGVCPAHFCES